MPLYRGVCYPDDETAKMAACSAVSDSWGDGPNRLTVECSSLDFSGATMDVCTSTNGGSCVMSSVAYPPMPDCDFSGGTDLASDWMGAAAVLLALVWGSRQLIKLFDGSYDK